MRARIFHIFQISDHDRNFLAERYAIFAMAQNDGPTGGMRIKTYEDWAAPRLRSIPIVSTLLPNVELTESLASDQFLENWDWELCSHINVSGPRNLDRQQAGYSMAGIEFDLKAAVALGCEVLNSDLAAVQENGPGSMSADDEAAETNLSERRVPKRLPAQLKKRGRPPGSGALAASDAPLLKEIGELVSSGLALSANAAAARVAPRALGGGTEESRAKRLRDAFLAKERKGD
jgi:hypothetical protein